MKIIKNSSIVTIFVVFASLCGLIGSIDAMKPNKFTYTVKSKSRQQSQQPQRRIGLEDVWVKTLDGQIMAVPKWQIDQMKVLQILFVSQKGTNNKDNPIDAVMVTAEGLQLLQKTLDALAKGDFDAWYKSIRQEFNKSLTDKSIGEGSLRKLTIASENVGATSLFALLAALLLPQDIQNSMLPEIIEPIVVYLEQLQPKKILQGHKDAVFCVAFSSDGNYIVSGSRDSDLILWNGKTGQQIKILKGHTVGVRFVAFSSDGEYIVSGSDDRASNLILWNGKTGEQIKILEGCEDGVRCVAFSPNGEYIVSGSSGKRNNLILWNGKTGEQIKILHGHKEGMLCVAFSPDGRYIVSGSYGKDNNLILWNGKTGEQIKILEGYKDRVFCVAFSPDGNYIVSGSKSTENNLILWNGKTGEQIQVLQHGHKEGVLCVAFSPDGNYIVSGSYHGTNNLILWNGKTGEQIKILEGHKGSVDCVAFSPDGEYIVSGSESTENNLILWNGKTGQQIKILEGHQYKSWVFCVAFSQNGNYFVSGSTDGQNNLILWKLVDQDVLDFIKTKLTLDQARFIYRLYLATLNQVPVIIDENDLDYFVYKSLPHNVQKCINTLFSFQLVSKTLIEAAFKGGAQ